MCIYVSVYMLCGIFFCVVCYYCGMMITYIHVGVNVVTQLMFTLDCAVHGML